MHSLSTATQSELILFGVLVGCVVLIIILLLLYIRLLRINASNSKDKEEAVTYRDIWERVGAW